MAVFDTVSYDGSGDSSIAFDYASGDIYSLTVQKGEDDDEPMTLIVEDYSKQVLCSSALYIHSRVSNFRIPWPESG
jgi:hypothetical protein